MSDGNAVGPRGGVTTRKSGWVRKTIWFQTDEAKALRTASFKRERSEAALVREAIRRYFRLPDD